MKVLLPLVLMLLTVQEQWFEIMKADLDQKRPEMHLDERLMKAADFKARLIAETGIIDHCINGYCPNRMIKDFGCKTKYGDDGNQVESITVGHKFVSDAYYSLKNSPSHRDHILGENFFKEQDEIGIRYYEYGNNYYYVFISANCEE